MFDFRQVQALAWLGENAPGSQGEGRGVEYSLVAYMKAYEQHGWPVFSSEIGAFTCRKLLGLPLDDLAPHFTAYLDARGAQTGALTTRPLRTAATGTS